MTDSPQTSPSRRFSVQGMSCAACVAHVERIGARVPGVERLRVNLATAEASVWINSAFDPATFAARLESQGYAAQLLDDTSLTRQISTQQRRDQAGITRLKQRVWLAAALTAPIFIVEMGSHLLPWLHHALMTQRDWLWPLQALITLVIMIGPGREFFSRGGAALRAGAPDMNTLVALGAGAAFGYSLVSTFIPAWMHAANQPPSVYFESAAVIMTLVLLGRWLEARARAQTGDAVTQLMQLQPARAHQIDPANPAQIRDVDLEQLVPGDWVLIKPGERIALDGRVLVGRSSVDQSAMTGESLAIDVGPGDRVIGGTLNHLGALQVEITHASHSGLLANIIATVAQAQAAKVPIQALADRITQVFVPVVLLIALLTFTVWYGLSLASGAGSIAQALLYAVAVLIIACPCAMGLATPTAIMVATGRAAQLGILYRDGARLQALASITDIAFDKTGTLTQGQLALSDCRVYAGDDRELLQLAASLEAHSEHPIAAALVAAAQARNIPLIGIEDFSAHPGAGVSGSVNGQRLRLGNQAFVGAASASAVPEPMDAATTAGQSAPAAHLWLMREDQLLGSFCFTDSLKPDAGATLAYFAARGIDTAMISGDTHAVASRVAAQLGIERVFAPVLPAQKAAHLQELSAAGAMRIAFVGDGINDAPALAAAQVGIALGTGTDIAIQSADCVVMSGQLTQVAHAHALACQTLRIIKQNLFWAFAYNVLLIPVAAGAFSGVGISLSPMLAALAMAASSLLVIGNSLRLRYWQGPLTRELR